MNDLLEDPIFHLTVEGKSLAVSLPEMLALYCRDETGIDRVDGLMAHQQHVWHCFMTQLAALALRHVEPSEPLSTSPEDWRDLLLSLAPEPAWKLFVSDLSQPAFMQPPVPEGNLDKFKGVCDSPSDIDLVILSKDHELKIRRQGNGTPEQWVYALVALQTFDGYLGRGNYGIARMNGGLGARLVVSWSLHTDTGNRFRRDLKVLRATESRQRALDTAPFSRTGYPLLWAFEWDGDRAIELSDIDPYAIEVCRRLRFAKPGELRRAASTRERVVAKERKGDLGDPWVPIVRGENKALTVGENGVTYKTLTSLLDPESGIELAPCNKLQESDGESPTLWASVLSRGQGVTPAFTSRELRVPRRAHLSFFGTPTKSEALSARIYHQLDAIDKSKNRVLKPALCILLQGAPDKLDLKDPRPAPILTLFESYVESHFFEHLWAGAELDNDEAAERFECALVEQCRLLFEQGVHSLPIPSARRSRAVAQAELVFGGAASKHLGHYKAYRARIAEERKNQRNPQPRGAA